MSTLTDRIAAEHFVRSGAFYVTTQRWEDVCACGARFPTGGICAHIAAVTEADVRERAARDIREKRDRFDRDYLEEAAYDDAARIALGVDL